MNTRSLFLPPYRRHALGLLVLSLLGGGAGAQNGPAQAAAGQAKAGAASQAVTVASADPAAASADQPGATASQTVASAGPAASAPGGQAVAELRFSQRFMRVGNMSADLSRFNKGNVVAPGQYLADLYLNKSWKGRVDVSVRSLEGGTGRVQPCMDRALLEQIGVDLNKLAPQAAELLAQTARCAPLEELVHGASAVFDAGEQRLDVSVPQVALQRDARGYVDPAYWDDGITAARLAYNASIYRSDSHGAANTQGYVGLQAGLNMGAWRLRHSGSFSYNPDRGGSYQSMATNLQRAIVPLKSQLTIGDAYTDGTMFDSVGFRGVQLASDDRMVPQSQRGYAPTVHGIANSNARVQIRQNGNIIYETTVAPGAFEIDDLYPTGYGGDLEVIVTEADGSTHISRMPFAPPVNAVRPGVTRYSVAGGQYRDAQLRETPWVAQGQMQHGFNNMLTGYGGVSLADGYTAVLGGVALNTDVGAFGLDLTHAATRMERQPDRQGQSMRLSYSKLVAPTNTNIALAAYRYSSRDYLSLQDAMRVRDAELHGADDAWNLFGRTRGRLQLTLNQALPDGWGSFYASASTQNYWNRDGRDTQFSAGYSNSYKSVSYGVSAVRSLNPANGQWDNRVMLTLGIPLGSGVYRPYASTSVQRESNGMTSVQESVSGTLGEDHALSYGLSANHSRGGGAASNTSVAASASYQSPFAQLGANVSRGRDYTQAGASASGGLVVYGGGVAFTPSMGETTAIVEADDAAGARVASGIGLRVDPWGRALVSSLTPFARNQIEIDPKGLPMNVELKSTQLNTAPTSGAVVRVKFETQNAGRAAILRLTDKDGKPLPFGAQVFDAQDASIGTVAQGGRVIVRGLKADSGQLHASWGEAPDQRCAARYTLPRAQKGDGGFSAAAVICQTGVVFVDVEKSLPGDASQSVQ